MRECPSMYRTKLKSGLHPSDGFSAIFQTLMLSFRNATRAIRFIFQSFQTLSSLMSIACGAGIILLLLFNLTSTTHIRAIDTCLFHARARESNTGILSRDLKIFSSLCLYTRLIPLLRLIEFSFDLRKPPQYARVLAVSRSYTIFPLPFPLRAHCSTLFLCLSLYRILFLPRFSRTRLYRQGITAQQYLEKLSSFHQANSESNATPYNSIRRRRKKCKRKRSVVWCIRARRNKKKKK